MIEILENLIPFPKNPVNSKGDWDLVERELCLKIPEDYKLLINKYGDYNWNNFLWLFNPFTNNENLNLITKSKEICEYEFQLKNERPYYYPIGIYPENGGIFPWAVTDNGDYLFWITKGDSKNWPTMIKESRAPEFEVHFMNSLIILHNILENSLNSMIIPNSSLKNFRKVAFSLPPGFPRAT